MTFEVICWICAGVIAIIGIIMAIATNLKPTWTKAVGVVCIALITVCIIIPFVFGAKLAIITPISRVTIKDTDYVIKEYNGKRLITIPITINGKGLPKGKFVTLLTSDAGGTQSWVNGGSTPSDVIGENSFLLENITFGEKVDGKLSYYCYLILTDDQLKSGDVYDNNKLPRYLLKSDTVMITVQK